MSEHFDAVVGGSGFGGSVMACRLAEAGLRVCVLERGKAYPPGSFPRAPHEMKANFWDPSAGLYGLFNLWSFPGAGALVSSALGGGSHIYANVLIRKDERWFEDMGRPWPVTRADLDPHYDVSSAVWARRNIRTRTLLRRPRRCAEPRRNWVSIGICRISRSALGTRPRPACR